jgi:hypothetical protein
MKMKRMHDKAKGKRLIRVVIVLYAVLFILSGAAFCHQHNINIANNQELNVMRAGIDAIDVKQGDSAIDQRLIEFLENETATHRQFIESQESMLIWLVGALAGVGLGLLAFFGYSSKKDIEENIEKSTADYLNENLKASVDEAVDKRLSKVLEDEETLEYFKTSLKREIHYKRVKIVFAYNKDDMTDADNNRVFDQVRMSFKNKNYNVSSNVVALDIDNYKEAVEGYDIIVYKVSKSEYESSQPGILMFKLLSDYSHENNKQCVLLVPGRIDLTLIKPSVVTTVNFISKLRETLYMLIYFMELNG